HLRLFRQIIHRDPRLMHHQRASRRQSHHRHRPSQQRQPRSHLKQHPLPVVGHNRPNHGHQRRCSKQSQRTVKNAQRLNQQPCPRLQPCKLRRPTPIIPLRMSRAARLQRRQLPRHHPRALHHSRQPVARPPRQHRTRIRQDRRRHHRRKHRKRIAPSRVHSILLLAALQLSSRVYPRKLPPAHKSGAPMTRWACDIAILSQLAAPSGAMPQPHHAPSQAATPPSANTTPLAAAPAPPEPARKITAYTLPPALYAKAKTLGTIRFAFRLFSFFFALFALWLILRTKLSATFRNWAEAATRFRFLQALIYTPLFALAFALLQLPLDLFNESLLKRYGISVQPWPSWTADWAKAELLTMLIGSIFAWILFTVIRFSPRRWWFYFWTISIPISLFIFFLQPVVIDPLFNQFAPLSAKAPELIPQLERITLRGGMPIPPERMFWMLASDKTIYPDAYVTGIGATKRVVIWDTSLTKETTGGILTMFGHEMGHYALHHVWKGL